MAACAEIQIHLTWYGNFNVPSLKISLQKSQKSLHKAGETPIRRETLQILHAAQYKPAVKFRILLVQNIILKLFKAPFTV